MKNIFLGLGQFLHRPPNKLFVSLFLSFITLAVYFQVRNHAFINFDDNLYVTENRHVQGGLTLDNFVWAFIAIHAANWHPITWLSHMMDCQLFGVNAGRHHLINLFFHILNTLLLFFIFKKMTGKLWQSAFIAALFAIHPLHVESVAWISERKDVLSTFSFMLTIWYYIEYVKIYTAGKYLLVILFFAIGLMSKPMIVTLPFVLFLLDFWPLGRIGFQAIVDNDKNQKRESVTHLILEKTPLLILVILSSCITFYAQKHGEAVIPLIKVSLKSRIMVALVAYAGYIEKMICPVKLAVFYPYPKIVQWWEFGGAIVFLVLVSFLSIIFIKKRPYLIVGWLWYLGTLVPVVGLVQVGSQSMADRYTYVPLIGIFIMIAWGMPELLAKWRYGKILLGVFAAILISLLTAATYKQVGYWKNNVTLFEHAIEVTNNNYVACNNLGVALKKQGDTDEAVNYYLRALEIYPLYPEALLNLANALSMQGKTGEAIHYYLRALIIKPSYADAHYNLANALVAQGKAGEARNHYLQAIKINPSYAEAYANLGNVLVTQGQIDEAIRYYKRALQIKPDFEDAYYNLGIAFFHKQDMGEAINCFQEVLRMNPENFNAKKNLQYLSTMNQKQ